MKRHNEIRDETTSLLKDVTSNVKIEPNLQPLTEVMIEGSANINDNSRLDVKCTEVLEPSARLHTCLLWSHTFKVHCFVEYHGGQGMVTAWVIVEAKILVIDILIARD